MPKREAPSEMSSVKPFNPLSKDSLGRSLTEAFLKSPLHPLPPNEKFAGAGVYSLYYSGGLPLYRDLVARNAVSELSAPIYVGKAVPLGSRKGGADFDAATGHALYARLRNHAESIRQAEKLEVCDFECRYLIVDDVWIPLAESLLIAKFRPLWNLVIDGFGNNPQGKGRKDQKMSSWDVIHSGRKRAEQLKPGAKSKDKIEKEILEFLKKDLNASV
jgi:hypothetical protein